jgi:hypothetical protein
MKLVCTVLIALGGRTVFPPSPGLKYFFTIGCHAMGESGKIYRKIQPETELIKKGGSIFTRKAEKKPWPTE